LQAVGANQHQQQRAQQQRGKQLRQQGHQQLRCASFLHTLQQVRRLGDAAFVDLADGPQQATHEQRPGQQQQQLHHRAQCRHQHRQRQHQRGADAPQDAQRTQRHGRTLEQAEAGQQPFRTGRGRYLANLAHCNSETGEGAGNRPALCGLSPETRLGFMRTK